MLRKNLKLYKGIFGILPGKMRAATDVYLSLNYTKEGKELAGIEK